MTNTTFNEKEKKEYIDQYGVTPEKRLMEIEGRIGGPAENYMRASKLYDTLQIQDAEKLKTGLLQIVDNLHKAYEEGSVGSIESLPAKDQIGNLKPKQLQELKTEIGELYFP